MESVLEVYQTAYNPKIPVICIDEATKQLVKKTLVPIPAERGQLERFDDEYERNGTANLFMICEPMMDGPSKILSWEQIPLPMLLL